MKQNFRYRKSVAVFALMVVMGLAQAHEFWMQPIKFFLKPGEHLVVSFKVGENFMGEPWDMTTHKIERLDLLHGSESRSVRDSVMPGKKNNLSVLLKQEGTHLLVMQSDNAFIGMEGDKFNEYLKEDGLDEVFEQRKKTNTLTKPSREYFTRFSKLLVQVGKTTDDTFGQVAGFPVEVVPESNPYAAKIGDVIRYKILHDGKPVFGAKVRVWNRWDNRTTIQNIYTEKNGTIEAIVSNPGMWMVSVVRMVPATKEGAEWQSYWASLTFGIRQ
ncbi:DUF4198 domain-containing protein [Chryseolinea lacunae]|uniref:DUF4198 domain-containing protein n=1 Tax=Chryseolinea lacunae TaxID=2801331 RepID=A0ABS1L0G2_9BACT|nr:DUF4198 domain-containing protein [Chryseolinea lacunae]MBL0745180.1 DUF4198 domain-containing protein [Chryseolinea lacunae]